MSEESDIEIQTVLPKKKAKKPPRSPTHGTLSKNQEAKKPSTKEMIHQALTDMKSRKGISLYAIKKYIEGTFHIDVEKLNYLIKKSLKDGVEGGSIVQTKGMGATGSFRLAAKAKAEKKPKAKKEKKPKQKPTENKIETKEKKGDTKKDKTKEKNGEKVKEKQARQKEKIKKVTKIAKGLQTPAKKKSAMMKRKSIGSIIKPPKMRPKARA